jgi:hypothetical protein
MIEGVEILSQSEVALITGMNWTVFGIFLGLSIIIGVVTAFWSVKPVDAGEWILWAFIVSSFIILGAAFGSLIGYVKGDPTKYEMQYKVIISDEVQMNEFFERYEIIEQEGKIYTIREKTNESD